MARKRNPFKHKQMKGAKKPALKGGKNNGAVHHDVRHTYATGRKSGAHRSKSLKGVMI